MREWVKNGSAQGMSKMRVKGVQNGEARFAGVESEKREKLWNQKQKHTFNDYLKYRSGC